MGGRMRQDKHCVEPVPSPSASPVRRVRNLRHSYGLPDLPVLWIPRLCSTKTETIPEPLEIPRVVAARCVILSHKNERAPKDGPAIHHRMALQMPSHLETLMSQQQSLQTIRWRGTLTIDRFEPTGGAPQPLSVMAAETDGEW